MTKISDEYMTPLKYLNSVREVFGGQIDLDPASSIEANIRVQAKYICTKETGAFNTVWAGRIFVNPPYSKPNLTLFSNYLLEKWIGLQVIEAIILVPTSPWERWFINLTQFKNPVCNTDHRIKFVSQIQHRLTTQNPKGGGSFIYLGNNEEKFIQLEVFRKHGTIWRRI